MFTFDIGGGGRFFFGSAADDVLQSTAGNDIMLGGLGGDTFIFGPSAGGQDRVYGYQPGVDKIQMGSAQRTTMIEDVAGGVLIQHGSMGGGGHSVILVGIKAADLPPTDFVFV